MLHSSVNSLASTLLQALPDTLLLLDRNARVEQYRAGVARLCIEPVIGTPLEDCLPADTASRLRELLQQAQASATIQTFEYRIGAGEAAQTTEVRVIPRDGSAALLVLQDISARRDAEAGIRQLAYHDALTGLANRELFERELRRAIRGSVRRGTRVAVLFIDLDRFKRINDSLGHSVGDSLLQGVARRLETCMRPTDVIARPELPGTGEDAATTGHVSRLGGDEFVILLTDLTDEGQAARVATRVRHALSEPFMAEGHQFVVTPSIGIAIHPDDGTRSDELLRKADRAMYAAKAQGRNRHAFYRKTMGSGALAAIEPESNPRCGWIVGAEALLR